MGIGSIAPGFHQGPVPIRRPDGATSIPDANPARGDETRGKQDAGRRGASSRPDTADDALNLSEQRQVDQLQKIDASVRAHELAHVSAGGRFVKTGARFQYRTGPDGRQYAVAGEVSIDTSPVPGDPQATVEKMDTIRAAALAPADPSSQDQRVAAMASRIRAEALMELSLMRIQEQADSARNRQEISGRAAIAAYREPEKATDTGSSVDLVF